MEASVCCKSESFSLLDYKLKCLRYSTSALVHKVFTPSENNMYYCITTMYHLQINPLRNIKLDRVTSSISIICADVNVNKKYPHSTYLGL